MHLLYCTTNGQQQHHFLHRIFNYQVSPHKDITNWLKFADSFLNPFVRSFCLSALKELHIHVGTSCIDWIFSRIRGTILMGHLTIWHERLNGVKWKLLTFLSRKVQSMSQKVFRSPHLQQLTSRWKNEIFFHCLVLVAVMHRWIIWFLSCTRQLRYSQRN